MTAGKTMAEGEMSTSIAGTNTGGKTGEGPYNDMQLTWSVLMYATDMVSVNVYRPAMLWNFWS